MRTEPECGINLNEDANKDVKEVKRRKSKPIVTWLCINHHSWKRRDRGFIIDESKQETWFTVGLERQRWIEMLQCCQWGQLLQEVLHLARSQASILEDLLQAQGHWWSIKSCRRSWRWQNFIQKFNLWKWCRQLNWKLGNWRLTINMPNQGQGWRC